MFKSLHSQTKQDPSLEIFQGYGLKTKVPEKKQLFLYHGSVNFVQLTFFEDPLNIPVVTNAELPVLPSAKYYSERLAKDYDAYDPPGGNQFISTYRQLGTYVEKALKSECRAAQEQALIKSNRSIKRPLVNMISYSSTIGESRRKYWKDIDIHLPPDNFDNTNYITISKSDYINYYPQKPIIPNRALLQKPVKKFRRLLVDGSDPRRPGYNKFHDDNQEYLYKPKDREPPPFGLCYEPKPY